VVGQISVETNTWSEDRRSLTIVACL
jgi:hypothetical protein